MATTTITAIGSGSFTLPADTYEVQFELWSGGGGGGGTTTTNQFGAGGGGGSAYVKHTIYGNPGDVINYFVGAGGSGGTDAVGSDGTDTWVVNNTTVLCKGGKGGQRDLPFGFVPNYGEAGLLTQCIGQFRHNGGRGGGNSVAGGTQVGGASGGSGAGDSFDGNIGLIGGASAGGAAVVGGINGGGDSGKGGNKSNNGSNGVSPGGGGGGGAYSSSATTGGNGGNGQLIITWTPAARSKIKGVSSFQGLSSIQF